MQELGARKITQIWCQSQIIMNKYALYADSYYQIKGWGKGDLTAAHSLILKKTETRGPT